MAASRNDWAGKVPQSRAMERPIAPKPIIPTRFIDSIANVSIASRLRGDDLVREGFGAGRPSHAREWSNNKDATTPLRESQRSDEMPIAQRLVDSDKRWHYVGAVTYHLPRSSSNPFVRRLMFQASWRAFFTFRSRSVARRSSIPAPARRPLTRQPCAIGHRTWRQPASLKPSSRATSTATSIHKRGVDLRTIFIGLTAKL